MIASGVPTANLYATWAKLWPMLKAAYDKSPEKADILSGILRRDFQLWMVSDSDKTIVAGICTKLLREQTSGELHCHLWLVSGSRMSLWAGKFIETLKPWALAEGCAAITGNGRPGWARIVARMGGRRIDDRQGMPCWRMDLGGAS